MMYTSLIVDLHTIIHIETGGCMQLFSIMMLYSKKYDHYQSIQYLLIRFMPVGLITLLLRNFRSIFAKCSNVYISSHFFQ